MPQSQVSVEDTHGVTPLHMAASSHIARLLVAAGGGGRGAAGAFNARSAACAPADASAKSFRSQSGTKRQGDRGGLCLGRRR